MYTTHVKHVFSSNLILLLNLNDTFLLYRFTSSAIRQRLFIFTLTKVNIVLYHQVQFASHSAMQVLHFLNLVSAQWQFSLGRQFGLFGLYGCSLYLACILGYSVSAKWQFSLGRQFGLFGLYGCSLYLVCSLVCSVSAKWQFELGMQLWLFGLCEMVT